MILRSLRFLLFNSLFPPAVFARSRLCVGMLVVPIKSYSLNPKITWRNSNMTSLMRLVAVEMALQFPFSIDESAGLHARDAGLLAGIVRCGRCNGDDQPVPAMRNSCGPS